MHNLLNIINYLSIGSSLLLAFLLILNPQKTNKKGNLWFGCFILCIFFLLFGDALVASKMAPENEVIGFALNFPAFLIAPIFYLSVDYYINPTKKWRSKNWLLFSFGFFMIGLFIATRFLKNPSETKQDFFNEWFHVVLGIIFGIVFSIQLLPYFYFSYLKILKHQKNVRLFSSTLENVDLKWLEYMIISALVMAGFWIMNILFQASAAGIFLNIISNFIYLISFFFIAYHSVKQKEIYPFNEAEKEALDEIITETGIPAENRKKLLPDDKLEALKTELITLMETGKPFLDCELSLVKLAAMLHVSTHVLSYVINTGFDENFYQFVNRYRIEEAKKLLINPNMHHFNLIGIAYEVGFNSKTVFNTTFKKYTEKTPSEFKKTRLLQQ